VPEGGAGTTSQVRTSSRRVVRKEREDSATCLTDALLARGKERKKERKIKDWSTEKRGTISRRKTDEGRKFTGEKGEVTPRRESSPSEEEKGKTH